MLDVRTVELLLGADVDVVVDLGSRHSWSLHRVTLRGGVDVFVKATADCPGVFGAEAEGLRWLAQAGPETLVPEVLAVNERVLVLPWLEAQPPTPAAAERFGRELAGMHAVSPGAFGAPWPGFIADLPLDNTMSGGGWAPWYAERRLTPFLRRAAGFLSAGETRMVERVIENVDALAGPAERPARIHGDLWSGNVLWSTGRGMLIDPAAHGGHRETDVAMLALFGVPYLDRIVSAYQEVRPLSDGWTARVPLHQLHPLLVHLALFGASYRVQVIDCASAALASLG